MDIKQLGISKKVPLEQANTDAMEDYTSMFHCLSSDPSIFAILSWIMVAESMIPCLLLIRHEATNNSIRRIGDT